MTYKIHRLQGSLENVTDRLNIKCAEGKLRVHSFSAETRADGQLTYTFLLEPVPELKLDLPHPYPGGDDGLKEKVEAVAQSIGVDEDYSAPRDVKGVDQRLQWMLRVLTDEFGALGVLRTLYRQYPRLLDHPALKEKN